MFVVGARPQFIKSAPVIKEILSNHKRIHLSLIHSGQHYDPEMSRVFFRELELPNPSLNLRAGSGSHATQTATIMKRLEACIQKTRPDVMLALGDTNTTLAASLTAAKLGIPVAHIEAGMRSGDMTMPEEINRKLTDHCSSLLFAPTRTAVRNLKSEGLGKNTYPTGDTMVDALHAALPLVRQREDKVLARHELNRRGYVLVTLHRPSNVDDAGRLRRIQLALNKVATRLEVLFPVHPRTRARLRQLRHLGGTGDGVALTNPWGYIENLCVLKNAACLLTDSGGMQKEAFLLHVPCVTLRSTTEWPETLVKGANRLVTNAEMIARRTMDAAFDRELRERIADLKSPFGDGHASRRIVNIVQAKF
jgi:UDP-N-acetylglucosamine 2-epimerase